MLSRFCLFVFIVSFSSGCASFSKVAAPPPINLSDMQKLEMGKLYTSDLRRYFDHPSSIFSADQNNDLWIYDRTINENVYTRATFRVDKATNLVMGAVWVPTPDESYVTEQAVLAHFKENKFTPIRVAQSAIADAHHDEVDYVDLKNGISYKVMYGDVWGIGFSVPQDNRAPAVSR